MKNCVISAVGRESLHRKWLEGEPDFDLHLIVYDDSLERFRGDAGHVCHIKGYKLKSVYRYLAARPELLGRYEYFFVPDDDILMDATTINALFAAMRHYRLKIAQPALCRSYYTWGHTLRDRYCRLRYTDFVEMMVPCFSREALEKVLFTFNENETGWGTETHWPLLIDAGPRDMAIVDEVGVVPSLAHRTWRPICGSITSPQRCECMNRFPVRTVFAATAPHFTAKGRGSATGCLMSWPPERRSTEMIVWAIYVF